MASSPSLRSIEASWTAPKDNGGQPITKYLVQWITDDDDDVAEAEDFDTTDRTDSATIGNDSTDDAMTMGTFQLDADLEDDTVYVFRVAAVSQDADGNDQPQSVPLPLPTAKAKVHPSGRIPYCSTPPRR